MSGGGRERETCGEAGADLLGLEELVLLGNQRIRLAQLPPQLLQLLVGAGHGPCAHGAVDRGARVPSLNDATPKVECRLPSVRSFVFTASLGGGPHPRAGARVGMRVC